MRIETTSLEPGIVNGIVIDDITLEDGKVAICIRNMVKTPDGAFCFSKTGVLERHIAGDCVYPPYVTVIGEPDEVVAFLTNQFEDMVAVLRGEKS